MQKIYVRPMSLSYGSNAYNLIKLKKALPVCGNKKLAFSNIEIAIRGKKNKFKNIDITQIKYLPIKLKKNFLRNIKNITKKRKKFKPIYCLR